MAIALFITIVLGLIAVLLSLENDKLKKFSLVEKKAQSDKIYKLSVFKEIQEKIAYTSDVEKVIDIIIATLKSFFDYSTASSIVVKNDSLIFKAYAKEQVSNDYVKRIEKSMLSSLSSLTQNLPGKIDKRFYGVTLNDAVKLTYSSTFHIPLIVKNKVLALIHLSSTKENLYKEKDMETLYQLIEIASLSLTNFNNALDTQRGIFISLIKNISDGIFIADNKKNLLLINDSGKKILGLPQDNIGFFDIVNIFSQSLNLGSKINEVILNNKPFTAKGIQVNDRILDISVAPIASDKVSVVLDDITDYKKKEILKEDLVHIMVHELRSPITTIKDAAQLIISTKNALPENKKLQFLEIIHQQAKKLLGRIGSILDTAKLDAGKLTLQKTKGDIAKLIKEEIKTFMPHAERKNISLNFDILSSDLPLIFFDAIRIAQVIDNLLSNSLKFTPQNGHIKVEIDYKAIPPILDGTSPMGEFLSLDKSSTNSVLDKYIVVSVSDTGIGIAKEQQKFLFSKYTQAKNTPQQLAQLGTGLGLYLVKGIIESHDGRIWVKSAPGQGTTISFTLPSSDTADVAQNSYDKPKPPPLPQLSQTIN